MQKVSRASKVAVVSVLPCIGWLQVKLGHLRTVDPCLSNGISCHVLAAAVLDVIVGLVAAVGRRRGRG